MERRRIQMTGGSSYIVTLPKDWVKSQKLKKNDEIGLKVLQDGDLLITSEPELENLEEVREFKVSENFEPDLLFRLLLGAYINGYKTLKISTPNRIDASIRESILLFNQTVTGFIIIEETINSITLQDSVENSEIPITNGILRMSFLVQSMLKDALVALETRDNKLCEYIIFRDNEINASHWLIMRQANLMHKTGHFYQNLPPIVCQNLTFISQYVERIGNHAVLIVRQILRLNKLSDTAIDISLFTALISKLIQLLDQGLNAFFKFDIIDANQVVRQGLSIEQECKPILKYGEDNSSFEASIINIVDYIIKIADICSNIGEMTIDSYVVLTESSENKPNFVIPNLLNNHE